MTLRTLTICLLGLAFWILPALSPQLAHAQKKESKITPELEQLSQDYQAGKALQGPTAKRSGFSVEPLYRVRDGKVLIDAVTGTSPVQMQADLASVGLKVTGAYGRMISGWLPIERIGDLEEVPSLQFARAAMMKTSVGSVTSQGDASMRTDDVRSTFGFNGTGLTVGILSDTFDEFGGTPLTTYSDDIASGDLPASVNIIDDTGGPGIDEGRAMAQLVYDSAPNVGLAFHTAFTGQAAFAQGIQDLAMAGSDVIVDDIIYFAEPMFQDGIIAQSADAVAASGIPYFSSAGNSAKQSYEAPFRPSGQFLDFGFGPAEAHDFDPGSGTDIWQEAFFSFPSGVTFSFQWDDPFFSVSGSPGADTDLDICISSTPSTAGLIACGTSGNFFGDPVEVFGRMAGTGTIYFAITNFFGPNPDLMKLVWFRDAISGLEYATNSSTSYGHANAAGAEAVGAAFYDDTPEFGTSPPLVESFSSEGGVPILFDVSGNRLSTPEVRQKPGITAPDGTNTTFFLSSDPEGDGFPNFFGTSAAAPHAAAAAALLLQAQPSLTTPDVYNTLRNTAIDMDDPATGGFDTGFDFRTGFGLVDAFAAVQSLNEAPECTFVDGMGNPLTGPLTVPVGSALEFTVEGTDPDGDNVDIAGINVPSWGTMTPALPVSGAPPVTSTFTGTPGSGDIGSEFATYQLTDDFGADTQCSIAIDVVPQSTTCDGVPTLGSDQVDTAARTVSNTMSDNDGIQSFTFSTLDNFTGVSITPSADYTRTGDTWTYNGSGTPPMTVDFTLQAGPTGEATYFLEATDACPNGAESTDFDPIFDLGPVARASGLAGAYPNPFSGTTTIEYSLVEGADVHLVVYDVMGRQVATLADGPRPSGVHSVAWNGTSDGGRQLASGLYLMRLQAGDLAVTRRVTLVR